MIPMRVRELYSKQIYNGEGYHIGPVSDVIINITKGSATIIGLTTPALEKEKKMIPYTAIKAIGDIIILHDT